jgi:hypothetical protein
MINAIGLAVESGTSSVGGRRRERIICWRPQKQFFGRAGLRLSPERMTSGILSALALEHALPHLPSGAVERHQQSAVVGSPSRVDESRDFFLAQNR